MHEKRKTNYTKSGRLESNPEAETPNKTPEYQTLERNGDIITSNNHLRIVEEIQNEFPNELLCQFPYHLFAQHPELVEIIYYQIYNRHDRRETIDTILLLVDRLLYASDGPNYTALNNSKLYQIGSRLYSRTTQKASQYTFGCTLYPEEYVNKPIDEIPSEIRYNPLYNPYAFAIAGNQSGDEQQLLLPATYANKLKMLAFAVNMVRAFTENLALPENQEVNKFLSEKQIPFPYYRTGGARDNYALYITNLNGVYRSTIVGGKGMIAQSISKEHFVAFTNEGTVIPEYTVNPDTGLITYKHAELPRQFVEDSVHGRHFDAYKNTLIDIGLELIVVAENPHNNYVHYAIGLPRLGSDLHDRIDYLQMATDKLLRVAQKEEAKMPQTIGQRAIDFRPRTLDLDKLRSIAHKFVRPENRGKNNEIKPTPALESYNTGNIAFYNIVGLDKLREQLKEEHTNELLTKLIIADIHKFTAETVAEVVGQKIKNSEPNPDKSIGNGFPKDYWQPTQNQSDENDTVIILAENWQDKLTDRPELFISLLKSLAKISSAEYRQELQFHLHQKYPDIKNKIDEQIINNPKFKLTCIVGLSCAETAPHITNFIELLTDSRDYNWTQTLDGAGPCIAARNAGYVLRRYNVRIELLEQKLKEIGYLTPDEQNSLESMRQTKPKLDELNDKQIPAVVIDTPVAKKLFTKLNLPPEQLINVKPYLKGVKGFSETSIIPVDEEFAKLLNELS